MHPLYTRSYRDGLRQEILDRPLHHGPTAGDREEDEKFGNWYEKTRILYNAEFGGSPPAGLWPIRFNAKKQPSRSGIPSGVFPLPLIGAGVVPVPLTVAFVVIAPIIKPANSDKPKKKRAAAGGDLGPACRLTWTYTFRQEEARRGWRRLRPCLPADLDVHIPPRRSAPRLAAT